MNINPIIISALSPLSLPISPNIYKGEANEYIVFNYADERPALYADDTDIYDETTVQVHYFTKGDPQTNKKAIRKLLRQADFLILNTAEFYEDDTGFTHIVVEATIYGNIEGE